MDEKKEKKMDNLLELRKVERKEATKEKKLDNK
jgi:hypothetical protein